MVAEKEEASSPIVYLGEDRVTRGDWLGRYGNECFILCAMEAPQDIVGGRLLPKRRWKESKTGFAATSPVWTDWQGEFFYEVETGDPKEPVRHWIPLAELVTDDVRALRNPMEGRRRYSSWDDHGEAHPFDMKGPDLLVTLEIPAGLHRLTLYFIDWDWHNTDRPRGQRVFIRDEKDELVCSANVARFGEGVYKVFGVVGPRKLRVRIQKDRGVAASLSGIFLDEATLSPLPEEITAQVKEARNSKLTALLTKYEQLRQRLASDQTRFLHSAAEMQSLLELTSAPAVRESATAAWLQWQCYNTLLVDPAAKERAFCAYAARAPAKDAVAAGERVKELLRAGEIALAEKGVAAWVEASGAKGETDTTLNEAALLFCKRDPDFALSLLERLCSRVKGKGERKCQLLLTLAERLMEIARQDAEGPLHSKCVFRLAAAAYELIKKEMGAEALGDEGMFRLAETTASSAGYYLAYAKRGIEAYQEYLNHYPEGKWASQAHLAIINLAAALANNRQPFARRFADLAAASAQAMLARASPQTGYGLAVAAAYQVGEIYTRAGDTAEAKRWYEEVVKRAGESPLGKRVREKIK
jgi:hypothetical protein